MYIRVYYKYIHSGTLRYKCIETLYVGIYIHIHGDTIKRMQMLRKENANRLEVKIHQSYIMTREKRKRNVPTPRCTMLCILSGMWL